MTDVSVLKHSLLFFFLFLPFSSLVDSLPSLITDFSDAFLENVKAFYGEMHGHLQKCGIFSPHAQVHLFVLFVCNTLRDIGDDSFDIRLPPSFCHNKKELEISVSNIKCCIW